MEALVILQFSGGVFRDFFELAFPHPPQTPLQTPFSPLFTPCRPVSPDLVHPSICRFAAVLIFASSPESAKKKWVHSGVESMDGGGDIWYLTAPAPMPKRAGASFPRMMRGAGRAAAAAAALEKEGEGEGALL